MISICIPIYNFDVTSLVKSLSFQAQLLDAPSEIIIIDDCSDNSFKMLNEYYCKKEIYIQLHKNIGRSAIRNKFLEYAKYDKLLFLDCDSTIQKDNYLSNYIDAIKLHPNQLICGGRNYPKSCHEWSKKLRWKYGIIKESKPFEIRNKNPNKSFMTNNFVISKEILDIIKFDERLVNYGHEDTLFGYQLKKRNITILHIDNPVLNGGLDDNAKYISDTEKAISNLIQILKFINYDEVFIQDVALLQIYYKFFKFRKLILLVFIIFKPIIKFLLSNGFVNLYLFDFYKLGTLALKMNKRH